MSSWDETKRDRDTTGKFSEMPGSAPESALTAETSPWGDQPKPPSAEIRQARYQAAVRAYQDAGEAITVLSAQSVAAGVREHYPDAVGVTFEESDQSYDTSYDIRDVVLADGSTTELTDEQWDDLATAASDIRPDRGTGWFTVDGGAASMSIDDVLALEAPQAGHFVTDDVATPAENAADRAEYIMRSGRPHLAADLSTEPVAADTALRETLTDLVHFADKADIDLVAIMDQARDTVHREAAPTR